MKDKVKGNTKQHAHTVLNTQREGEGEGYFNMTTRKLCHQLKLIKFSLDQFEHRPQVWVLMPTHLGHLLVLLWDTIIKTRPQPCD